jgi:predicted sulfurtransferase
VKRPDKKALRAAIQLLVEAGYEVTPPLIDRCKLPDCGKEFIVPRTRGAVQRYCCSEHRVEMHERTAAERMAKHRLRKKLAAARQLLAEHGSGDTRP